MLIELLERSRGRSISGEELARLLGVSRAAVWKAVGELKKQGYRIEAVTNKGYRLAEDTDILSAQGILPYLGDPGWADRLRVFSTLDSTNEKAKALAQEGAPHNTAVLADAQTQGRGRQGRSFFSPPGGVYLSLLLRPQALDLSRGAAVTAAAAVAVSRAVEETFGRRAEIKWVNDLYLDGRKICGILTEALCGLESGRVDWLVIGVGINVGLPAEAFPAELRHKAGSLFPPEAGGARCRLAAALCTRLAGLEALLEQGFAQEYRRRSLLLDREIRIERHGVGEQVRALDLDDQGRLVVERAGGERLILSPGQAGVVDWPDSL